MYLRESFVTSCKGTCMHTSLFRQLLQTVDARPHVNTVKIANLYPVPASGANGGSGESFMERG